MQTTLLTLRPHQQKLFDDDSRKILAMWSRLSGKTTTIIEILHRKSAKGNYLCVVNNIEQLRWIIENLGPNNVQKNTADYSKIELKDSVRIHIMTPYSFLNYTNQYGLRVRSIILDDICLLEETMQHKFSTKDTLKYKILDKALSMSSCDYTSLIIVTTPPQKHDTICDLWWDDETWSKHNYASPISEDRLDLYRKVYNHPDKINSELLAIVPKPPSIASKTSETELQ